MVKKLAVLSAAALMMCVSASTTVSTAKNKVASKVAEVSDVTDASFEKDVLKSAQTVLVDCYAPWCGPCRSMAPIVHRLAKKYKNDVKVVRLDVDKNPAIADKLNISGIPLFVIFKNGKAVETAVGAMPKEQLSAMVERGIHL